MPSNTQKVIKGVSSQTLVTIVLGIVEIVSFSIMSRLLSQKDFGYYAAIIAVATIFQSLADTGIGASLVQKKELDKHYINSAFSLSLLFGIVISGLLCTLSGILARFVADETMTIPLRIFSITLLCSCLSSVNISLMQRQLQFLRIGLINLISLIVTTVIAIILALQGYGYYAILTKAVLQSVLVLVISYFAVKVKYKFIIDTEEYKRIFNFGGWLMASAVFRNVSHQVDKLLMTSLFSIETLGLYTRPKEFISQITSKLNNIFDSVLFPVLSTIQDEKERLQKSFQYAIYFLNLLSGIIAIVFFFNSKLIIRIFFGEQWLHINTLFQVLSFYVIFLVNGRLADIFLRSLALTKQQFFFRVGQLIFAVIFILIVYRFGIIAVAVSVVFSYFLITTIKIIYLTKKMSVKVLDIFLSAISAFKFYIFIIPIYIICAILLPDSWMGNSIQSIVFILIIGLMFLVLPSSIGQQYKNEAYIKVMKFVKSHIVKK